MRSILGWIVAGAYCAGCVSSWALNDGTIDVFAGEPRFERQEVFSEERFPNIVVTREGTVLAVWGEKAVRVRRSEDGGKTWGPEIPVGPGIHGGGAVVNENSGEVLVFVEENHPPAPVTVYRSADDGRSWKAMDVIIHLDEKGNVPSMHMNEHGIMLRRGDHAGRLIRPTRSYGPGNAREYWDEHYTNAIYSDDGGKTWHASAPFPAMGTGEAAVAELFDGRIYYNSRRHRSTDGLDPRWRHIAWSHDGGERWENLSVSEVLPDGPRNLDYGLMGGLVRLPVAGSDILLFSNVDSPGKPKGDDSARSERRRGTVWVSFDGGVTWPLKRLVGEGPFAYSSLTAGRAGTESEGWIYLLSEGTTNGPHIGGQVARFNFSWLLGGVETGDGQVPAAFADLRAAALASGPAGEQRNPPVLPERFSNPEAGALWETDVYWQGMNGYHTFRIPSLIEAPDGTMLAFAEGRKNSSSDTGDIDTVLRRSFDGGKTWTPMQIVWDDGPNTCGNPTVLVDRTRGRIWLLLTHNLGQDSQSEISNGTSDGVRTIWSMYSDDHGATWSPPQNRFHEVQKPDTRWDATGPGNGIQLTHGPHAGRLIVPANGRNLQSDDFGRTWKQGAWLPGGTSEATVAELSDGRLLRNSRATGKLRDHRRRITSVSADGGASWSPLEVREDLPCPICQGSMIAHALPDDGRPVLYFSNPAKYAPDDRTSHDRRLRMTVRKSESDGETFEHSKVVFPRDAAYSSLAGRGDGNVALLYENGDDWPYRRISYATFSSRWIEEPGLLRLDFDEFTLGSRLPPGEGAIVDRTGYGIAATATVPLRVVHGRQAGDLAVSFAGSGRIRIDDTKSRGRLNLDADTTFAIRVVFRTRAHQTGGAGESGALIAKDVGPSTPSWWLRIQDGKARFWMDDGESAFSVVSERTVSDGRWHELSVVRDAERRYVWMLLDGKPVAEAEDITQGDLANQADVSIGAFNNGGRQFQGEIACVEIGACSGLVRHDRLEISRAALSR